MKNQGICLVCGEPVVYFVPARSVACSLCGREEKTLCTCKEGHFVCNECHRSQGVDLSVDVCLATKSTNPIEIMIEAMRAPAIYPNGPEHHTLVGTALIAAYANAGGALDRKVALAEMKRRSVAVPGGACGFWGCCGASISAGQALSIIIGSTPLSTEAWARCQRLTSEILGHLADIGGPRCCKRTGFTAALIAIDHIADATGVLMQKPEHVQCEFFAQNKECLRRRCPYFPASTRQTA